jgi:hypothetical protein
MRRANGDYQPVRRMLAAPNLITASVIRLDAGEGREKITRESLKRKFTELHNESLFRRRRHCRQIGDSHKLNLGVKQNIA